MKQCCANCKWLIPESGYWHKRCSFYDQPARKTCWWTKLWNAPIHHVQRPKTQGKTCKCWQEKR